MKNKLNYYLVYLDGEGDYWYYDGKDEEYFTDEFSKAHPFHNMSILRGKLLHLDCNEKMLSGTWYIRMIFKHQNLGMDFDILLDTEGGYACVSGRQGDNK